MKSAFEAYQKMGCTFDPFYKRENAELQQLVDSYTPLTNSDIQHMIAFLTDDDNQSGQYFTMDFLALYKVPIPMELYKPIFDAGIRHFDPSFNRLFFIIAAKMKGRKQMMKDLTKVIQSDDLFRKVMAIQSLYWNFYLYWSFAIETVDSYELYVKPKIVGKEEDIYKLLAILMDEFLASKNYLVQYVLADYLPKSLKRYPPELKDKAKIILNKIKKEGLPMHHKSKEAFHNVWKRALVDKEVGILFFDQLQWRSRGDDPESEE